MFYSLFVIGCRDNSRIEEIENRLIELQKEIIKLKEELSAIEEMIIEQSEVIEEPAEEEIIEELPEEEIADEENLSNEVEPEQTNVAAELANALISNNYDIRYIDYSEDEHPYQGYYNYVQLGIKDENIPTAGNWGGPSWEEVQNIIEVIKKYYPDSEVWIICFFNNSNGQYAVETHSIPELNIGGGSKGTEPPTWVCNGINPIWGAD